MNIKENREYIQLNRSKFENIFFKYGFSYKYNIDGYESRYTNDSNNSEFTFNGKEIEFIWRKVFGENTDECINYDLTLENVEGMILHVFRKKKWAKI